jgi:SAM-dependent methyltransferase
VSSLLSWAHLVLRERTSAPRLASTPEPAGVTIDDDLVRAFHAMGEGSPYDLFAAQAASALVPARGHVVDLGCGSAQLLLRLLSLRPDVTATGLDLSEPMLALGRETARANGLADRVSLIHGDMCNTADILESLPALDLIMSVRTLHHLPALDDAVRCLSQIARATTRRGCAVFILDNCRNHHPETPIAIARGMRPENREDALNSMRAAFSFEELVGAADQAGLVVHHRRSRELRKWQAHWMPRADGVAGVRVPLPEGTSFGDRLFVRAMRFRLPGLPG